MRIRPSAPAPSWRWQTRRANPRLLGLGDEARPVVDEHEIVAPAVHFIKGDACLFPSHSSLFIIPPNPPLEKGGILSCLKSPFFKGGFRGIMYSVPKLLLGNDF